MLYNLIITPIETIVGWTFFFFNKKFSMFGPAAAIVGVSLIINFLALPLYNIADSLQEKERQIQKSLEKGIKRIKHAFKGDEQFMILQTYYKQNNYHPLYVLRSSLSILIEVPFFIAAYHYLSNCEALRGVSFLFMKDLGAPDRLFSIPLGTTIFYINILPVLMTVINLVSGAVYSKEAPFREKIQIYVLAAIFLVLLYNSPSGLVFYWILNNLFSLAKNVIKKMKNPGKVLHFIISGLFIAFTIIFFIIRPESKLWKKAILVLFTTAVTLIPLELKLLKIIKSKTIQGFKLKRNNEENTRPNFSIFLFSAIGLALLCGLVLPSSVIATSPIEFSYLGNTENPLSYIFTAFFVFTGMFLLWPFVIYKMFGEKVKASMSEIFFVIFITAIFNAFIFKSNYGKLNTFFRFINTFDLANFPVSYFTLPFLVLVIGLIIYKIFTSIKQNSILSTILLAVCVAELSLGIYKVNSINKTFTTYKQNLAQNNKSFSNDNIQPYFHLSKTEKNVVVLFLDRAVNVFFERIMNEFPELKPSFDGFVYYPNTLSFGSGTDRGAPAMMGGYEYTPYNMNQRADEPLVNKHNEATLVLPKLFLDAGYNVFVTDPPWPNYEWKGDLSAFEKYPEINVSELVGKYSQNYAKEKGFDLLTNPDEKCRTNLRNFTVLEILFPFLREFFYQNCYKEDFFDQHIIDDLSVLYYLPQLTDFTSDKPTYAFIDNETTHSAEHLNPPYYDRPASADEQVSFETMQYHTNVAAYKTVAAWLDYLRKNNCFDNTRIIIVADHAIHIGIKEFENVNEKTTLPEKLNCILLVKDFNSKGPLKTVEEFMTNADTVFLAKDNLNVSDTNPFTGKQFVQKKENGITIYDPYEHNLDKTTTQFSIKKDEIFHVNGDVKNPDNWVKVDE